MEKDPPLRCSGSTEGGSFLRYSSIFMQSIKILPPAEMGPEADPLLREKDGRKLPGWGQWDLAPQGRKQFGQDA